MPTPESWLARPYVAPDANCITLEDGDCVSTKPCMHWPGYFAPSTYDDDTRADVIVQAYDELDLRIIADMEGGH